MGVAQNPAGLEGHDRGRGPAIASGPEQANADGWLGPRGIGRIVMKSSAAFLNTYARCSAILLAGLLSGCFQTKDELTLEGDGSGKVRIETRTDRKSTRLNSSH